MTGLALGTGILASIAWGIAAFTGAISARYFGTWVTNLGMKVTSAAVLVTVGLSFPPRIGLMALGSLIAPLVALGVALLALDLVAYRLLAIGPVAIIYPLLATSQAMVAVLAIATRGEHLSMIESVGLVAVALGVIAIAFEKRTPPLEARVARAWSSRSMIIAASVTLSVLGALVILARISFMDRIGWYYPVLLDRGGQAVVLTAVFASRTLPRSRPHQWSVHWLAVLLTTGVLDGLAVTCWAVGATTSSVAVVSIITSTYVVIPVLLGVLLLRERPQAHQAGGIAAVVAGIALLST